ncbi:MAG TPA: hypothetical protein DCZ41_04195 [Firmicutes bacterium]|nr:hypothetical protein [Bacillota bacterium]
MKKCFYLAISILTLLSSCGGEGGRDLKSFVLDVPKATFFQYDKVDYSAFKVSDAADNQVSDFEIYLDNSLLKDKESRWLSFGKSVLTFKIDGIAFATCEISVSKSSEFKESLEVVSYPSKSTYGKGDVLDLEGLKLEHHLSYTRSDKEKVQDDFETSDYTISVDGNDDNGYRFEEEGYAIKYAIATTKDIFGADLSISFPLYQSASSKSFETKKIIDSEEKYEWSEEGEKMKVRFSRSNKAEGKSFYAPEEVNLDYNLNSFMDHNAIGLYQTPSIGEVPLLVVPVVLNGFESAATPENHLKIEKAFFSKTGSETDSPVGSLSSYYYYSSFHKLRFVGEVTPYFNPTKEGYMGYSNPRSFSLNTPASLAMDALKWAKETLQMDLDSYDSDNDGFIDGLWLIYIEDIQNELTGNYTAFWPFTTAGNEIPGTKSNPSLNVFSWAGSSHLYGSKASQEHLSDYGYDTNVLCHETGHLLGLTDYYSYEPTTSLDSWYSPLGGYDMMDLDFGDHNPYSKMLLGWIKPYVVLGDCEIEIESCQKENSFFLLPYDGKTYEKDEFGRIRINPFDEYLLLDYDTYENLYKETITGRGRTLSFPKEKGGRLYHVDARVVSESKGGSLSLLENPDSLLNERGSYFRAISNTQSGSRAESAYQIPHLQDRFDEIRLISSDKTPMNGLKDFTSDVLFGAGKSFSLEEYSDQFVNASFDSKNEFSLQFSIISC